MDFNATNFWDILLWSIFFFVWIAALSVWLRCMFDVFSDPTMSGWGKAGWALVLILFWFLGALIYLIARGRSMGQRQLDRVRAMQSEQEDYIKKVAGGSPSPTDQIASAKALLDSGAISQQEFDLLKAKALV